MCGACPSTIRDLFLWKKDVKWNYAGVGYEDT
jgi:hypothetical protein